MLGSGSQHEVELLFQSKSIAEVREVETKTRHEIEEKKKQLRQVVGGSYRDLISSADTIIDIARSCHSLVSLVGGIQEGLGGLSTGILERKHSTQDEHANTSYDRLYALGSRVKYLIDTPETIWGCLDAKDYLEAARRFVRSAEVHRGLAAHSKQILHRFPLLQHQWPLVKKFRSQIWDRALDWLGSQGELTSDQLACTLLALALLKPMDGAELLRTYLSARQRYIAQCLEAAAAGGPDSDLESLTFILGDVLVLVYRVVAQCGELFLQLPGVTSAPHLVKVLDQEDLGLADLAFDPKPDAKSEIAAWKAVQQGVRERLAGLSGADVAAQCSAWLETLSSQFKALGGQLLGSCGNGRDLLAAESGVKAALESWTFELKGDSPVADGGAGSGAAPAEDASQAGTTHSLSWNDASHWVLGRPLGLWPLLLEHSLVERAKQLVARDFTTVVGEVTSLLGAALEEAEALPPSTPGAYLTTNWSDMVVLQPGTPPAAGGVSATGRRRRRLTAAKRRSGGGGAGEAVEAAGPGGGAAGPQAWLQQTERALQLFDQQLSSALAAALDACYGPAVDTAGSTRGPSMVGRRGTGGEYAPGRALILEPFVQDRCMEAAQAIAAMLEERLSMLPAPAGPAAPGAAAAASYAPTAQKSLIIGRVALAVAGRSSALRVILGPPEQWQAAARGGSGDAAAGGGPGSAGAELARRLGLGPAGASLGGRLGSGSALAAAGAAGQSAKLAEVQQRFRSLGLQSYAIWADWAAHSLSAQLLASLASDLALVTDTPLRGWEETVVSPGGEAEAAELDVGGELGPAAGEMRFWLPAAPSAAAMEVALGACREADHAGGHLVDDECLAMLKWHLAGALLSALGSGLAPGGALAARGLSEKGILQLLLDLRFLQDLLSGGGPVAAKQDGSGPAGAIAAIAARRRELSKVEEGLQAMVDPIDWATYESYLYANKERFAARCQVLFGLLLRSEQGGQASAGRRGPTLATPSGGTADSNVLRMAAGGPRFSYLPVNTPSMLRQASLQHSASGQLTSAGSWGPAAFAAAGAGGATSEKYSFASGLQLFGAGAGGPGRPGSGLGGGVAGGDSPHGSRPGSAAAGGPPGAGGGPGVGASALDAIRQSRFGSLLGDKAAEVTAMASGVTQSLGEYSFSSTLLSSFNLPGAFKGERR